MQNFGNFLLEKCTFKQYDRKILEDCQPFDCGHDDLNSFFKDDAINYSNQLLGKSHCFTLDADPKVIVCAFTVSNDSVKANMLPNSLRRKVTKHIPREKTFRNYPAVLIGRLGVQMDFHRTTVATELMDFITAWFREPKNKTGCRYIVVDSYNEERPVRYYEKNGFTMMFPTEEQEKTYLRIDNDNPLRTRLMYKDLILLKP